MQTKWVLLSGLLSLSPLGVARSLLSVYDWSSLNEREMPRDEIRERVRDESMGLSFDWLSQAHTTVQPALDALREGQPVPTNLVDGLQGLGLQVDNLQGGHLVPNMNAIMEELRARIQEMQNLLSQRVAEGEGTRVTIE